MAFVALHLLALLLAFPGVRSSAPSSLSARQSAESSAPLVSVTVSGSSRFTSQQIAPFTGMKVGASITRADLQSGANRLAALGCFAAVQYKFSSGPAGVAVEYAVTDAPMVPVEFDNFIWLTDAELASALTQSGILFDGQAPERGAILGDMSSALEKILDAHGVHAQVAHELVQNPGGSNRMQQFRVEGLNLTVSKLEFNDSLAQSSLEIHQQEQVVVGRPYSRVRLELFEQEQVLPFYRAHAFLQASFAPPSARFAFSSDSSEPGAITAVITVHSGAAYKWGGVEWQGNSHLLASSLDALVKLRPGDPADGVQLQGLWLTVQNLYGQHGFLDAALVPKPQFDKTSDRVTYTAVITEGAQYHMRNLVLSGLSVEGERRIRAAFPVPEGNLFDESAYRQFLDSGIQRAFAGLPVHYEKIGRFLDKHPETAQVDVLLDFQ